MNNSDEAKLEALRKYREEDYQFESLDQLYDDYHDLCYQKHIADVLENNPTSDYEFSNIEEIDITNLTYDELESLYFHWSSNKYQSEMDANGIPATIGANSRGIDKEPSIFFSGGVEGALELWNTWLKWRLYRLESPIFEGLTDKEVRQNMNRYFNNHISKEEKHRWNYFNYLFTNKKIIEDRNVLRRLFEYQYLEMQGSTYYSLDLDGLDFDPSKSIDYNKVNNLREAESNKFLEFQYDDYSDLNSIYSDKWNYRISPSSQNPDENLVIGNERIKALSVKGTRDLNTVITYFYEKYKENVPEDKQVKFDVLDTYMKFVKIKRNTTGIELNEMMNDKAGETAHQKPKGTELDQMMNDRGQGIPKPVSNSPKEI